MGLADACTSSLWFLLPSYLVLSFAAIHLFCLTFCSLSTFKEVIIVPSLVCSSVFLQNVGGLQVSCFSPQNISMNV